MSSGNLESLSKNQRAATPEPFARLLMGLVENHGGASWYTVVR